MTKDTFNRAKGIDKTITKLEHEKARISKMFSVKENLTDEELEDLFQIAMVNTDYTLKKFKEEFESL